jgi:MoaA/NifB/PqqE/SkfB family radical SAM enzyme
MCDQWKVNPELFLKELSTEEWFRFVDSASRMHAAVIVITGGEALLREDLFDIIQYIRSKSMACHVCSNGTLLNKFMVDKLRESKLNSISVSVDSCFAQIHNKLRGADCFNRVVEGIKLLKRHAPGIKVGINCVITKINFSGLHQIIPFAESLGVDQIKFDIIHTNLRHKQKPLASFEGLVFEGKDMESLKSELVNLKRAVSQTKLLTNSDTFINGMLCPDKEKLIRLPCYAGYISCAIDEFGWVSACDNLDGKMNLKDRPLEQIWGSESFQKLRQSVKNCKSKCWDTSHAELNIRCSNLGFLKELSRIYQETRFYLR